MTATVKRWRMSVSMTLDAVRERRKTVTRRHVDTWVKLKAGDRLVLIEKGQGLKKGEHQVVITEVEVVSVEVIPLAPLSWSEVDREGFAGWLTSRFCTFWMNGHGYRGADPFSVKCRRIEWRYLDE
jgi:hypothetical protein